MTKQEFEKLYKDNFHGVYHYLLKLCGNQHIAEEITSDTFFKAMNAIDKFDGKCNLTSWLCQIAKNTYFSYLRKNKQFVQFESLEAEESDTNIEKQLINSITSKEICKHLNELEEPYKKVFIMRILQEFSFKHIGTQFNKSENWACVTYHRAKGKLQKRMEEKK